MKKYDESLKEVWGWKKKVYAELKGSTGKERAEKLNRNAEKIIAKAGLRLPSANGSKLPKTA